MDTVFVTLSSHAFSLRFQIIAMVNVPLLGCSIAFPWVLPYAWLVGMNKIITAKQPTRQLCLSLISLNYFPHTISAWNLNFDTQRFVLIERQLIFFAYFALRCIEKW